MSALQLVLGRERDVVVVSAASFLCAFHGADNTQQWQCMGSMDSAGNQTRLRDSLNFPVD